MHCWIMHCCIMYISVPVHTLLNVIAVTSYNAPTRPFGLWPNMGYINSSLIRVIIYLLVLCTAALCIFQITEITQEVLDIDLKTRTQRHSSIWKKQHSKRWTSSNFGEICNATGKKGMTQLTCRLIGLSRAVEPAIVHVIKYESAAVSWFERECGVATSDAWLSVCVDTPYLGATPDRITDHVESLEVNCPLTVKNLLITPATVPFLELKEDKLSFKRNHKYHYQVQGQLVWSKTNIGYFVVYTLKKQSDKDHQTQDNAFIEEMKQKLKSFFHTYYKRSTISRKTCTRITVLLVSHIECICICTLQVSLSLLEIMIRNKSEKDTLFRNFIPFSL